MRYYGGGTIPALRAIKVTSRVFILTRVSMGHVRCEGNNLKKWYVCTAVMYTLLVCTSYS